MTRCACASRGVALEEEGEDEVSGAGACRTGCAAKQTKRGRRRGRRRGLLIQQIRPGSEDLYSGQRGHVEKPTGASKVGRPVLGSAA